MNYELTAKKKLTQLKNRKKFYILAIESSCDETCASVTCAFNVLSNIIASQIDIHKEYGGVVPEIASRKHIENIEGVVNAALLDANLTLKDISAIAVTYGAGLQGALLVGVTYAKALAMSLNVPLIPVNHIRGHIAANYITNNNLTHPYICLIASGGHTAIAKITDYNSIEIIGQTEDDACGEAFDKVARVLKLPYPGGPQIEKLAMKGEPIIQMPRPFKYTEHYNFSYSGLKTAVINYVNSKIMKGESYKSEDIAASFQKTALDMLIENTIRASLFYNIKTVVIAGGVAANSYLRNELKNKAEQKGINIHYPELKFCTDNAAMIGVRGYLMIKYMKKNEYFARLDLDVYPSLKI